MRALCLAARRAGLRACLLLCLPAFGPGSCGPDSAHQDLHPLPGDSDPYPHGHDPAGYCSRDQVIARFRATSPPPGCYELACDGRPVADVCL